MTAATLIARPSRPSRTWPAGDHSPNPCDQRSRCNHQERDVDRGRAERDQAPHRRRLEAKEQAKASRDGRRDDTADRHLAPIDPAEKGRGRQAFVAGHGVDRPCRHALGGDPTRDERRQDDRGERLIRPVAKRGDDGRRHRIQVRPRDDRRRIRVRQGHSHGVGDHQRAHGQQGDPDRLRHMARRGARFPPRRPPRSRIR